MSRVPRRPRPFALFALALLVAAPSASALCGMLACPDDAPAVMECHRGRSGAGWHSATTDHGPSVSTCCAREPDPAEALASAGPLGAAKTASTSLPRDARAAAPRIAAAGLEAPARALIPLFTLHRSLLL